MRPPVRRLLAALLLVAMLVTVCFAWQAGRLLQHEDPLQRADAILVLAGARVERAMEAVDLYKAGWAPVIVLSGGHVEAAEVVLQQRGIRMPREAELLKDVLLRLGVPETAIVLPPDSVDSTAEEANVMRAMVQARHWHRVIVVTSKYHTRRSGFAFRRGLGGTGAGPILRASRYDESDPARWWRRRADVRSVGSEWVKLIFYRFGG
jgi:uncharacterized SAM-binding protein YcdF (DUF218 family)